MRFFVSFADQPAGGVGPTRRIHFSLEFPLISCGFSGFFFFKKKTMVLLLSQTKINYLTQIKFSKQVEIFNICGRTFNL